LLCPGFCIILCFAQTDERDFPVGIIYITPLVALFFGWLLLNEPITLRIVAGTVITFSGIGVSQARDYQRVLKEKRI